MQCSQCQHENPAAQKFCGECGARLSLTCPACNAANPPANKFCGECGAPLSAVPAAAASAPAVATPAPSAGPPPPAPPAADRFASPESYTPRHLAEKILTSRSAIEGERKQVTVMFTDVSGFTAMSSRLDPEDVHEIMDRCFEVILEAVHRYEGTINQFLGDGVMALFGAPIAHEDHAQRALRAALAIQTDLAPLREDVRRRHDAEFRLRIGLNTGLVVVGAIGRDLRMDYTAVGDTTNLASRILNIAQPGQVALSTNTHRLTDGYFAFDDLGEFQVKGKTEPIRVYAVTGERAGRTRLEVSRERGLTPLVGRDREVMRLTGAFDSAADGNGAIVLLVGEPGVGKSRLIYEFLRSLDGRGVLELEATGVSYGRSIPYRPILDLVRRYLAVTEAMSGEDRQKCVIEQLHALGIEDDESAILLSHFLGVSAPPEFLNRLSGAQLKERTFGVLREMFLRASLEAPVVVIVENLHWLDPSSEEFLQYFAAALSGHRVLLLLSSRPGLSAPWLGSLPVETIAVEGLDAEQIRSMTRSFLKATDVAEPLFKILAEKSEGNPLYVEEILRQLQETAGIVVEHGEAGLRSADVAVPATIHDIIAARVDRLAEPLKRMLQGAAVIGRRFGISLLSRVLATAAERIGAELRELQGLDFVFPSADDPELMYSFKHALTQDVVYAGLLERRRRQYHAAAGVGLEELYEGRTFDVVELIAYHFGRSAEAEKAVDYAILAGEKAQKTWANAEALEQFEAALKRLDAMPDGEGNRLRRIDAVIKQSEIKFALGRHAEHVQALEAIRTLTESADAPRRASWLCWAGFLHSLTGARPEVPIAYCTEATALADLAGLDDVRAFAQCVLSHVYIYAGNLRDSLTVGERALAMFEQRGNIWWACRTLWALSPAANATGEWERGLGYCRRMLEHAQALNDLRLKVNAWWRTGLTYIYQGDPAEGLRCLDEAAALSPAPFDRAMIRAARGLGLLRKGDAATAVAELSEAVAWFQQSKLSFTRAFFGLRLAEAHLALGDAATSRAVAEDALRTSQQCGARFVEGVAERILGETLTLGDPHAAARHLATASALLEEIGANPELSRALAAQAALRHAAGDLDGARKLLQQALELAEASRTLDEPARLRVALASLALAS